MCGKQRIKKIHGMVERVKDDGKASVEYMKIFERERMLKEEVAIEHARRLRENGVPYEMAKKIVTEIKEDVLKKNYME
jgi:hypothetical protein